MVPLWGGSNGKKPKESNPFLLAPQVRDKFDVWSIPLSRVKEVACAVRKELLSQARKVWR